jgi:dephospho-CoA kinase
MLRVGLTGGIACGKSEVLGRLSARGLATLDLDAVAHEVMDPGGAAYEEVVAAFGEDILAPDATIDRSALGAVVFGDPEARGRLEGIVHPRVRAEEARRASAFQAEGRALLVSDGAVLVEAGVHLRFDRLVVVHCPPEAQRRRLMARDGISEAAARARLGAQMPIEEKRCFGHLEVDTSGALEETAQAAEILAGVLLTEARGPRPRVPLAPRRALGALAHGGGEGPRGLDPRTLLETVKAAGGLEMPALARRLRPSGAGPWYRAARRGEAGPWPEALAAPLASWALARGADEEWLAGAAHSLARLTHDDGESVAGAVLAVLAAHAVVREGSLSSLDDRSGDWESRAHRWGRARPASRIRRALEAALVHPDDPEAARATAEARGAEPGFAGALVGAVLEAAPADLDPALRGLLDPPAE